MVLSGDSVNAKAGKGHQCKVTKEFLSGKIKKMVHGA